MDQHPTPFLNLLTLWRQGWLMHAELLRAAESARPETPDSGLTTGEPGCGCLPACC